MTASDLQEKVGTQNDFVVGQRYLLREAPYVASEYLCDESSWCGNYLFIRPSLTNPEVMRKIIVRKDQIDVSDEEIVVNGYELKFYHKEKDLSTYYILRKDWEESSE